MTIQLKNERGVVALLTTVFIGILLSVVTVALVTQMVSELRQAGDFEQSQKAYYAARSGVEDAMTTVKNAISTSNFVDQSTCSSSLNLGPSGLVGWSCQLIQYSATALTGNIPKPDKSVQLDTAGPNAFDSVVLEWDTNGTFNAPADTSSGFPRETLWAYAAPVELTIVEYPRVAFNAGSGIKTYNALFYPTRTGSGATTLSSLSGGNPVAGICVAAAYNCKATLSGLSSANYYLFRIRTRYVGTDYRLSFYSGSTAVAVPSGNATIDVTGRAGDAYRRLVYQVPYQKGITDGLDFVIYSDSAICKTQAVNVSDNTINTGACP
jgi:hypothetical protein